MPYELSAAMAQELGRQKVPHELITVRGAGHGLSGGDKKLVAEAHEKAQALFARTWGARTNRPRQRITGVATDHARITNSWPNTMHRPDVCRVPGRPLPP
jgi:hypothetical protein